MAKHIVLSITHGRSVRDLFHNGLLDLLIDSGFRVTVVTSAASVPSFVNQWKHPAVDMVSLHETKTSRARNVAQRVRHLMARRLIHHLMDQWFAFERHLLYPPHPEYVRIFQERHPSLVVATHVHWLAEADLICTAQALGLPTLGLVQSWDNVHKGIRTRPERLAVWNEINKDEAARLEGYAPDKVYVIGAPQFDPYFAADTLWRREEFAAHFNLDPTRPILVLATNGSYWNLDETYLMDWLMEQIAQGTISGRPQVICRLHPLSRLEYFQRYLQFPDVRLSYVSGYIPTLDFTMTREDVVMVANMLKYADVLITPGSTMTLEAAIFDTPTLVPAFHTYQPDLAAHYYATIVFGLHFNRIERLDLVPIIRRPADLVSAINRCLTDPGWYREKRAQLVRDYIQFTDGGSTRRLARLITQMAAI